MVYEDAKNEALKYSTRREFEVNSPKIYRKCVENGWIIDVCSHMAKRNSLAGRGDMQDTSNYDKKRVHVGK